jgi:poly-gamma-glutamate synthesis protein (capsule biosynthesis protein)
MKGKNWFVFIAALLVLLGLGLHLFSAARSNSNNTITTITLAAAGDILLDRGVRAQLEEYGYDYPYARVKEFFQKADIAFANLECPLAAGGTPVIKDRRLIFQGNLENGSALKGAGFTILNLANNHAMDYGPEGLSSTLEVLHDNGILPLGGGLNAEEARRPVYITTKGTVTGFLGYSVFPPEGYISFPHRAEIARMDINHMPEEIEKAKKAVTFWWCLSTGAGSMIFIPANSKKHWLTWQWIPAQTWFWAITLMSCRGLRNTGEN